MIYLKFSPTLICDLSSSLWPSSSTCNKSSTAYLLHFTQKLLFMLHIHMFSIMLFVSPALHCLCLLPVISQTPMNQASTRSHCIFTIHVCSREPGSATIRRSKLHLVDLAGSERVGKTGVGGQILTEAKYINLSLHYLEQVSGHAVSQSV